MPLSLPSLCNSCPFSIRRLNPSTHLIRENDKYGEYPHIYARTVKGASFFKCDILILSDTGCGTDIPNESYDPEDATKGPERWNLGSFLDFTLNGGTRKSPYLVITTHCHYDHIMGIWHLPPTCAHDDEDDKEGQCLLSSHYCTTVLSSCHRPLFITPYAHLQRHSICTALGLEAPHYTVGIWAHDHQKVLYRIHDSNRGQTILDTKTTILHTPGHTPDSLAWYDESERMVCVGDSFYEKESVDSRNASWGREKPMPTIFNGESNLEDWWESLKKVLNFARERNGEEEEDEDRQDEDWVVVVASKPKPKPRVLLCAAHVTASTDAESALLAVQSFMAAVLHDDGEVPFAELDDERGEKMGLWDYALASDDRGKEEDKGRFSVKAPLRVIELGRKKIPRDEWAK